MTNKLVKLFQEEYPPIGNFERVGIYGACERIHLNLVDQCFIDARLFEDKRKIHDLATRLFDVPFFIGADNALEESIFFDPNSPDHYQQNHFGHIITIQIPSYHPQITIDTGNRGDGTLIDRQRDNYFRFVKETYDLFLQNASNPGGR